MLSDEAVKDYKDIYKKEYGQDLSDEDARDQSQRLYSFYETLFNISVRELKRKDRLKNEPKGFHLDTSEGVYSCIICNISICGEETWWDINGTKCLNCQRNIDQKVIPSNICKNDKLWFRSWQPQSEHSLHSSTIKKLKKEGVLIGRDLKDENGNVYFTVYLVKENKKFFENYKVNPKFKINFKNKFGV